MNWVGSDLCVIGNGPVFFFTNSLSKVMIDEVQKYLNLESCSNWYN